jgi:DNA-binding winged helix-turn-helix (wHTH) protein/tetratricopeptide (TPR) repeat protein
MTGIDPSPLRVRFGEFELDEANALLRRGGQAVELAPTPFGLLCALARQPGALLSKHALLDQVWGHRFVSDSVLKTAISDLRSVLADNPREPRFIETVARRGYRFIAKPAALPAAPPAGSDDAGIEQSGIAEFVGRSAELARLRQAWDRASRGKKAIVWVAGAPGIGKTTLIERFLAGLGDATHVRGYCVEHYGSGEPYLPVLEALAQLCRGDDSLPSQLRSVAPMWLLQLPWLGSAEDRESLRRELAGVGPDRMLREMGELLDRYSERRTLLLVTEDLHWADGATIQLIDYLARRRSNARFMWLASFRLAEVVASEHPLNALRHELRLHGLCEEFVLDSFSEAEVGAFLARHSSSLGNNEDFVRALHERTDGVPLFVASVMEDVLARAEGSGKQAVDSEVLAQLALPESVTAIIDRYVLKLSSERRALLSAAAVCGMDFRIETLARTLERDPIEIGDACDQLMREQLWLAVPIGQDRGDLPEPSHAFRHTVFREVLYQRLPHSARVELHRKVGLALERERASGRPVTPSELAMHFDRGRSTASALRYYAEAAESALSTLSPGECMNLAGRGLQLLDRSDDPSKHGSHEIALATLHGLAGFHALGASDGVVASFRRAVARLADDPSHPMRVRLLHGLGFVLMLRAEYGEALAIADRAAALGAESADELLQLVASTLQGHVYMMQGRPRESRDSFEHALAAMATRRLDSAPAFIADPQVTALAALSLQLTHLGLIAQAQSSLERAYARARHGAQPMALLVAIWFDALCRIRHDDTAGVARLAGEMRELVESFSLTQGVAAHQWFRGWANARSGREREGFRAIREAYDRNRAIGMIAGSSETLGYAAEALLLDGDWRGAQEQLGQAFAIVNDFGERIYVPQLLLLEGAIAQSRGDPAGAEAAIRRAVQEAQDQGAAWLRLIALASLCERNAATSEERAALAALVDGLGETKGTTVHARARGLLLSA